MLLQWSWCTICNKRFHPRCDRCGGFRHGIDYALSHIVEETIREATDDEIRENIYWHMTVPIVLARISLKKEAPLIKPEKCPAT